MKVLYIRASTLPLRRFCALNKLNVFIYWNTRLFESVQIRVTHDRQYVCIALSWKRNLGSNRCPYRCCNVVFHYFVFMCQALR
jgi:hypothetical protein